ncbi:MAG: insulinase family protein [Candidatus Omnitrophica bacterium]|nr:insulinase family protein [Candidatus Omnitrophota bacterium]
MTEVININGLTLIYHPFIDRQTASLGIFLRVGSRIELKKFKGIAHFFEHMVFKGSSNYSCSQIKQEIEGRGGSLNAFTSHEMTGYYAQFLKRNFDITLDILLDMVFRPLFKTEDIDKERKVILEEIKMYNDLPSSRVSMLLDRLLWKGHPLGEEVIGYESTVKNIDRLALNNFKDRYYHPSNMVISFSGDFSKKNIINKLLKKIKPIQKKTKLNVFPPSSCQGLNITIEKKELEQAHLCLGFRGVSYVNPQRRIIQLINIILGANMSSRLFEELREKKSLCYDISTEVRKYKDSGAFIIHTGLDTSNILLAIRTILKQLSILKEKEVSMSELLRAKDYLLGQIAMGLEHPQGTMFFFAESFITLGKIYDYQTVKQEVEAVTALQIKNLAKKIFDFKNICISCIGPVPDNLKNTIKNLKIKL